MLIEKRKMKKQEKEQLLEKLEKSERDLDFMWKFCIVAGRFGKSLGDWRDRPIEEIIRLPHQYERTRSRIMYNFKKKRR